jgi:hypothetical protein
MKLKSYEVFSSCCQYVSHLEGKYIKQEALQMSSEVLTQLRTREYIWKIDKFIEEYTEGKESPWFARRSLSFFKGN